MTYAIPIMVVLVIAYKVLTHRLMLRAYRFDAQLRKLFPQIQALRQMHQGNPVALQANWKALLTNHGINHVDGSLMRLIDLAAFLAAWAFVPSSWFNNASFLWTSNVAQFDARLVLAWWLVHCGHSVAIRRQVPFRLPVRRDFAGPVAVLTVVYLAAWYWQWPAYLFVFWLFVAFCNAVGILAIWIIEHAAFVRNKARAKVHQQPQTPSPTPPAAPAPVAVRHPLPTPNVPAAVQVSPAPLPAPTKSGNTGTTSQSHAPPPSPPLIDLQKLVDGATRGTTVTLNPPGQYVAGPIVIRQPLVLDGQGATVWATCGPVISVEAEGVTFKNLHVEVTGEDGMGGGPRAAALSITKGQAVVLQDFEARGCVEGLDGETGPWRIPLAIRLGAIEPERPYQFHAHVFVPVQCRLESSVADVRFDPATLNAGSNDFLIRIEPLAAGMRLRGKIRIHTSLLTYACELTASAIFGCKPNVSNDQVVFEPKDWIQLQEQWNSNRRHSQLDVDLPDPSSTNDNLSNRTREAMLAGETTTAVSSSPTVNMGAKGNVPPSTDSAGSEDAKPAQQRKRVRPDKMPGIFTD